MIRRGEREVTDINEINAIFDKGTYATLACIESIESPYIVSLCYGYNKEEKILYFHGALEGKKVDIFKKNNNVAFQIVTDSSLKVGPMACNFSMYYSSIVGKGKIEFIENNDEKKQAFNYIMSQYTSEKLEFNMPFERVMLCKLKISEMTVKVHK